MSSIFGHCGSCLEVVEWAGHQTQFCCLNIFDDYQLCSWMKDGILPKNNFYRELIGGKRNLESITLSECVEH